MKFVPWNNQEAQIALFVNLQYWMSDAKIYAQPSEDGFFILLTDTDFKWKTRAIFATEDSD